MRYLLWLWYFRLVHGKWTLLHRLRLLWLDLQIAVLMLRFPQRIPAAIRAAQES